MVWAIGVIEITERVRPKVGNKKPVDVISKPSIFGVDLREKLEAPVPEAPSMAVSEIHRICKMLGLDSEDYLINSGSDLIELIRNSETPNLRLLYIEKDHTELQYLAKYRVLLNPEDEKARLFLIRSLYTTKNYEECSGHCKELRATNEEHIGAIRYIARCARSLGEGEEAFKYYSMILENDPEDRESLLALVRYHFIKGDYEHSIQFSDTVLNLYPENRLALIFKARTLDRLRDYEGALDTWDLLLYMDRDDIDGNLGMGKTLYLMGKDELSRRYLENVLLLDKGDIRAKRTLIPVLARMGSLHEAVSMAEGESRRSPTDASMWDRIISLYFRMGDREAAEQVIDDVVWLNGGSVVGYVMANMLATEFLLLDKKEAIEADGMEMHRRDSEYFRMMFEGFRTQGNLTEQFRFLKRGGEIFGSEIFAEDWEELINFLRKTSASIEDLERALEEGTEIRHTDLVIKSLIQRACVRRVESSWEDHKSVAMVSSSLGRGGAERQVVACLERLVNDVQWNEVNLLCYKIETSGGRFGTYEKEIEEIGLSIDEFGTDIITFENEETYQLDDWTALLDLLPNSMRKVIEPLYLRFMRLEPTVVHAWQDGTNIDAAIAALMAGVPRIVMFARSMRTDEKSTLHIRRKKYLQAAYQNILSSGRALLAHNSQAGRDSYADWLNISSEKFEVINNGVDFDSMANDDGDTEVRIVMKDLGIPSGARIVGGVFRVVEEKQPRLWVDVAAEIVSSHRDVHFILVGGGQLIDVMREEIIRRNLDGRIHLIGQSAKVATWLRRMDLFLLTSRIEGLPNVLIEAQGFGVPVISTVAGGSGETFLDGETGRLSLVGDKSDLVSIIDECLSDKEWLEAASSGAILNARAKFSIDAMYSRLEEIYDISKDLTG